MTIKELAESIGVSKTTINNTIKELKLSPALKEGHKQMLDLNDAEVKAIRDYLLIPHNGTKATEKTENQTEKSENQTVKSENQTEKSENSENKSEKQEPTNILIEMLREELKVKNEQLAIKDKQIEDLSNRLSEANANLSEALKATRGQQYIAAQDKAAQLMEADRRKEDVIIDTQPTQPAEPPAKKSWLAKMLGL